MQQQNITLVTFLVVNQRKVDVIWKLCIHHLCCQKKEIVLWCDGRPEDSCSGNSRKKRAKNSSTHTRRDELAHELKKRHCEKITTILNHSFDCGPG